MPGSGLARAARAGLRLLAHAGGEPRRNLQRATEQSQKLGMAAQIFCSKCGGRSGDCGGNGQELMLAVDAVADLAT
jgi:hypothetical protein